MISELNADRLHNACAIIRDDLRAAREPEGHWIGELASSSLSTATAVCALVNAEQYGRLESHGRRTENLFDGDQIFQGNLSELIVRSLHWLADEQNEDGGWGDTDRSASNIAATMLVVSAFRLTGVPARHGDLLARADRYISSQGGVAGLRRRYGKDKTFSAPILTCCALAGTVKWNEVPALPFELACIPQHWFRLARMPVVSYAIPALVAIGQARFHHAPPLNPATRLLRRWATPTSLAVVERMQPESGGFLEATPLTSFVVMALASIGQAEHPVARRGVEFLLASVRPDGSWPIDSNLATWNTAQVFSGLMSPERRGHRDVENGGEYGRPSQPARLSDKTTTSEATPDESESGKGALAKEGLAENELDSLFGAVTDQDIECLDWLLDCQRLQTNPFTNSAPGGWSWTNLSGGVPDADDTSGALLALAKWRRRAPSIRQKRVEQATRTGMNWLLDLQNNDGGWPTFCRGWGKLPFDRSANELTAHAVRAIGAWREIWQTPLTDRTLDRRLATAQNRGLSFLGRGQQANGSWLPLWFGNEQNVGHKNPVFGTARVLRAYIDVGLMESIEAQRAVTWLVSVQHASGGWGAVSVPERADGRVKGKAPENSNQSPPCSVEESAVALTSLLPFTGLLPSTGQLPLKGLGPASGIDVNLAKSVDLGLRWLANAVAEGEHRNPSPIGLYFAQLWYYERLYPLIFAAEALETAIGRLGRIKGAANVEASLDEEPNRIVAP